MNIRQIDDTWIAHTYARFPVQLTEGKGSLVRDIDGREYIDLGSGIAVNGFGISDDAWLKAVTAQLTKLPHASNLSCFEIHALQWAESVQMSAPLCCCILSDPFDSLFSR